MHIPTLSILFLYGSNLFISFFVHIPTWLILFWKILSWYGKTRTHELMLHWSSSWPLGYMLQYERYYFHLSFTIENWCIFQVSLEHSRNIRSTPENTIKGGTRHYIEPNWFNASLTPPSHPCIFFPHNISMSSSFSLSLCLVFYTFFSS